MLLARNREKEQTQRHRKTNVGVKCNCKKRGYTENAKGKTQNQNAFH